MEVSIEVINDYEYENESGIEWFEEESDAPEEFEPNAIFERNADGEVVEINVPDDTEDEEV